MSARRLRLAGAVLAIIVALVPAAVSAGSSDDPLFAQQYGPQQIDAPTAWEASTGAGVTIAVIDSGVDVDHPDLAAKLVPGRDYINTGGNSDDGNGHGTHVAGIAAAITGNGAGIAGVAPDASIMPIKVFDESGATRNPTSIPNAIRFAADNGARVINLSLGDGFAKFLGLFDFDQLESAIEYAFSRGSLCIVASGNESATGQDNPSGYSFGVNAVVVTANDAAGNHASFGNRADTKWAVSAPGAQILSTLPGGEYGELSGTSMATPHVAGVAALLFASGLDNRQVAERIVQTATPLPNSGVTGAGLVNAARSLGLEPTPDTTSTTIGTADASGSSFGSTPTTTPAGSASNAPPASVTDPLADLPEDDPLRGTGRGDGDFAADLAQSGIEGDLTTAAFRDEIGDYRKQTYGFLALTAIIGVLAGLLWWRRAGAATSRIG